jgi:hypothetical protein
MEVTRRGVYMSKHYFKVGPSGFSYKKIYQWDKALQDSSACCSTCLVYYRCSRLSSWPCSPATCAEHGGRRCIPNPLRGPLASTAHQVGVWAVL